MIPLIQTLILSLISLAAGILGTVSGGGGGSFVVPAMVSTINEAPSVLVGSVFLMYLGASVTGFVVYSRKRLVDFRSGVILAAPAVPGVVIGTLLENTISNFEFKLGLGLLTGCLALVMFAFRNRGSERKQGKGEIHSDATTTISNVVQTTGGRSKERTIVDASGRLFTYTPNFAVGIAINFVAGVLSGLFGAGAAIIIVPTTILFVRMPSHVAIATTRVILMALNLSAIVTHVGIGAINWYYALILAVGAIIGAALGAKIAFKISPGILTKIIATTLFILGTYLVISSFG